MRAALILGAALFCSFAFAAAPQIDGDGWYSWQVESLAGSMVYVRIRDGQLADLYTQNYHCWSKPQQDATHLGIISAAENFAWFRQYVENKNVGDKVREDALFGMVQSDSDEMYAYLDRLIGD